MTAATTTAITDPDLLARLKSKLSEYDIRFIFDKSGSMDDPVSSNDPKGPTRWQSIQEVAREMVATALDIDDDGIEIAFFSSSVVVERVTAVDQIKPLFTKYQPGGGTFLAPALNKMFNVAAGGKKDLFVVVLDGAVNDREETISELVAQSNRQQSDNDCTVIFLQVGDDTAAKSFLDYLDDNLESKHGAKFDIVDTIDFTKAAGKPLVQVLAEGIVG